jgi:CIC family chloride channel protein
MRPDPAEDDRDAGDDTGLWSRFPGGRPDWAMAPFGIFRDPQFRRHGRWILLSVLVGLVSGVGAILFDLVFRLAQRWLLGGLGGFGPPGPGLEDAAVFGPAEPWRLVLCVVLGGLLTGLLVFTLAPETEGHGTDAVIHSFHHLQGRIRRRVPLVKAVTAALSIGSGGSAGREGPTAQIGAGFGSFLGDLLKVPSRERRILMMAGVAGGIGAIFRAPLGAAFFAAEVLYSEPEFEYEVLLPGLIAAITGFCVYSAYAGWGFLFTVPPIEFHRLAHLPAYAVLGLACAMAGALFPPFFYGLRDRVFRPLPLPAWAKPAIGALGLGAIAVAFPQALGMGYGYIQEAIHGGHTLGFLLLFAGVKIVATSLTLSSGGSGGVFGPSLVVGGALGGAFGLAGRQLVPDLTPDPTACIMVGMCGFFGGVAKTPLAAVIMVMEMTGSYGLLVPCLLVAAVAYLTVPLGVRIYENQLCARVDSPSHTGDFAAEALRRLKVRDVCGNLAGGVTTLGERCPLAEVLRIAAGSSQPVFPVVDDAGRLRGDVSIEEIRQSLLEGAPRGLIIAADLMHPVPEPLVPGTDLATAARLLGGQGSEGISVVADREGREVVGIFTRRDLVLAYGTRSGTE